MKLTLVLLIVLAITYFSTQSQTTTPIITAFERAYNMEVLDNFIPCIKYPNCSICTTSSSCTWISNSASNGISFIAEDTPGAVAQELPQGSFCWSGTFYGGKQTTVTGVTMLNSSRSTITAIIGFNDFNYKQCTIKGGVALAAAIVIPLVAVGIIAVIILSCVIYCWCCRRRISKKNSCC